MKPILRGIYGQVLNESLNDLMDSLTVSNNCRMINHLISKYVLNDSDQTALCKQVNDTDRARKLIDIILKKPETDFQHFLDALALEHEFLSKGLEEKLVKKKEEQAQKERCSNGLHTLEWGRESGGIGERPTISSRPGHDSGVSQRREPQRQDYSHTNFTMGLQDQDPVLSQDYPSMDMNSQSTVIIHNQQNYYTQRLKESTHPSTFVNIPSIPSIPRESNNTSLRLSNLDVESSDSTYPSTRDLLSRSFMQPRTPPGQTYGTVHDDQASIRSNEKKGDPIDMLSRALVVIPLKESCSIEPEATLKIIMAGESSVGKTTLLNTYIQEKQLNCSHIGQTNSACMKNQMYLVGGKYYKVHFYDVPGTLNMRNIFDSYFKGCHGAIAVYDVNRSDSIECLDEWLSRMVKHKDQENKQLLVAIIGNKTDLVKHPDQYGLNSGKLEMLRSKYCGNLELKINNTSALYDLESVITAFEELLMGTIEQHRERIMQVERRESGKSASGTEQTKSTWHRPLDYDSIENSEGGKPASATAQTKSTSIQQSDYDSIEKRESGKPASVTQQTKSTNCQQLKSIHVATEKCEENNDEQKEASRCCCGMICC